MNKVAREAEDSERAKDLERKVKETAHFMKIKIQQTLQVEAARAERVAAFKNAEEIKALQAQIDLCNMNAPSTSAGNVCHHNL
jgi:hypothetical protein